LDHQEYSEALEDKPQLQVECYPASAPERLMPPLLPFHSKPTKAGKVSFN
jgi:hypothetical protein